MAARVSSNSRCAAPSETSAGRLRGCSFSTDSKCPMACRGCPAIRSASARFSSSPGLSGSALTSCWYTGTASANRPSAINCFPRCDCRTSSSDCAKRDCAKRDCAKRDCAKRDCARSAVDASRKASHRMLQELYSALAARQTFSGIAHRKPLTVEPRSGAAGILDRCVESLATLEVIKPFQSFWKV
jgi:hypothetical protein